MVVKLEDLKRCVPMVARFAGLNPGTLNPLKARLNEGQADFHLIERLSQDHLEKVIGEECGTVWNALLERCMQPHAAISED